MTIPHVITHQLLQAASPFAPSAKPQQAARLTTFRQTLDVLQPLFESTGLSGQRAALGVAPEIHDMTDPAAAVAGSIAFINDGLAAVLARAA